MSQSEDKKEGKPVMSDDHEENRLLIGELKWSKEDEEAGELKELTTDEETSKTFVQSEVSATVAAMEETIEEDGSSKERTHEPKKDPLEGIEDTLTPIDFKTYDFDPVELKAIEEELNSINQQTLEPEEDIQEYEEEETSGSKWLKITIWTLSIPALLIITLFVSLIIGHTVIGGQPVSDIFDMSMWQHLYNLIYG